MLCAIGEAAIGQDSTGPASIAVSETAEGSGRDSTVLTLEELKAAGPLRSSYRNHHPRAVGTEEPKPDLAAFRKGIQPILEKSCVQCHGPETQEGNIQIDTLDPDLLHGNDVSWWLEIVAVLSNGEMPPPDAASLADADRSRLIEWISSEIQMACAALSRDTRRFVA